MSAGVALLPIITMIGALIAGALTASLTGEVIVIAMLGSAAVASIIAVQRGRTWDDVQGAAGVHGMLPTALPSFVIAALVYTVLGDPSRTAVYDAATGSTAASIPSSATALLGELSQAFVLHWIVLLPPVVIIVAIMRRVPSLLAITLSSLVAVALAIMLQCEAALDVLLAQLLHVVRTTFALVAATMTAGLGMVALTSHGGVTMLVVGGLFHDAYRTASVPPRILSRSLEDSVTITEVLMPWTVSAVFMATTLGVPTVAYAPWTVFCWCGPVLSLLLAWRSRRGA